MLAQTIRRGLMQRETITANASTLRTYPDESGELALGSGEFPVDVQAVKLELL